VKVNNQRIIGTAIGSNIKASNLDRPHKSVFCVSNISKEYTQIDIVKHCLDNGVRVLFFYDITKADRSARSFKIAIAIKDLTKFTNVMFWPQRVFVRHWNNITVARSDVETVEPDTVIVRDTEEEEDTAVTMTTETVATECRDVDPCHSSTNSTESGDTVLCNDEQITNWALLTEEADNRNIEDNRLTTSDRLS